MKTAVFVILDRFADWESAYLSSALNGEVTGDYLVFFDSADTLPKTSIGEMTVLPQLALGAAPEEKIREYDEFYALGFHNALKKYGYVQ